MPHPPNPLTKRPTMSNLHCRRSFPAKRRRASPPMRAARRTSRERPGPSPCLLQPCLRLVVVLRAAPRHLAQRARRIVSPARSHRPAGPRWSEGMALDGPTATRAGPGLYDDMVPPRASARPPRARRRPSHVLGGPLDARAHRRRSLPLTAGPGRRAPRVEHDHSACGRARLLHKILYTADEMMLSVSC